MKSRNLFAGAFASAQVAFLGLAISAHASVVGIYGGVDSGVGPRGRVHQL
jgi:hypothetical protein